MKKSAFVFCMLVFCSVVCAQQDLYSGGWNTGNSSRFTRITVSAGLPLQVYRLDCSVMVDTNVLQFNVIADGVVLPVSFYEGSSVLVEARELSLQQVNPGTLIAGVWRVVQKPSVAATNVSWAGYAQLNRDILVASFASEQEFVLTLNTNTTGCSATSMNVYVDGVVVKGTTGQPLVFAPGSSVYGKGKLITLRPAGTCAAGTPVSGSLKVKA